MEKELSELEELEMLQRFHTMMLETMLGAAKEYDQNKGLPENY